MKSKRTLGCRDFLRLLGCKLAIRAMLIAIASGLNGVASAAEKLVPVIQGPWIQIAGNPDLGKYTSSTQEPVDFAAWQSADNTWQAWSCIRKTLCGGSTRIFYRWEVKQLATKATIVVRSQN